MRQKRSRKPAFVTVKATDAMRNKVAVHRFRAASFAGALCAKRTAKNRWTDQKMNAFIFWLPSVFLMPGSSLCVVQATGAECLLLFSSRFARWDARDEIPCRRIIRARSARKMILWIIFSESGPEGPGPAEALIVPPCQYGLCIYSRVSRMTFQEAAGKTRGFPSSLAGISWGSTVSG